MPNLLRSLICLLLAFTVLLIGGCNGCNQSSATRKDGKQEKKTRKKDFEFLNTAVLPGPFPIEKPKLVDGETEENKKKQKIYEQANLRFNRKRTKPGHWIGTSLKIISNNFDTSGTLRIQSVDGNGRAKPIEGTEFSLVSSRPFSLPKGEWKYLEAMVFAPIRKMLNYRVDLLNANGGVTLSLPSQIHSTLLPHQYHFVVLSNKSDNYRFLSLSDVTLLTDDAIVDSPMYWMEYFKQGDPVPLPSQALTWTTTAYLLWDDFSPDQLTTDQQVALVDWIHFGGQLILSGPDAIDKLQTSFLAPYLPSTGNKTRNLTAEDFSELNQNWAIAAKKNPSEKRELVVAADSPIIGIELEPASAASYVNGTGKMVVERRVGRGRIVMTSFSLDDAPVKKWRSFNSFLNGCLMRRPARKFIETYLSAISVAWADAQSSIFDPLLASTLRFTSRDLGRVGTEPTHQNAYLAPGNQYQPVELENPLASFAISTTPRPRSTDHEWQYGGFNDHPAGGVAAWNEQSAISEAARETLKSAAGISPPSASFVFRMLGIYLIVLVPVNWLFFKLIGKVEWAWIAAPIIAIIGSVVVVRMASLDIGFLRSNTQVSLVEVYGDYSRAHIAEYSAVYTSLSTDYNVEFSTPNAQSMPFPTGQMQTPLRPEAEVNLQKSLQSNLKNFRVLSNSTEWLHTEYIADLGGTFQLKIEDDSISISNSTPFDLESVYLFRRTTTGSEEMAKIGSLAGDGNHIVQNWQEFDSLETDFLWDDVTSDIPQVDDVWDDSVSDMFVGDLIAMEAFSNDRAAILEIATRMTDDDSENVAALSRSISKSQLKEILDRFERLKRTQSGFDTKLVAEAVIKNLKLEPGEYRLMGSMNAPLQKTTFTPQATQETARTLFLVHLKKPQLPPAEPDKNTRADFVIQSNLDQETLFDSPGTTRN